MKKYKTKNEFELREVAGDHVLLMRGAAAAQFNAVMVFNETGTYLWGEMSDFVTAEQLSAKLSEKFGVSADVAMSDTEAYLNKMDENGLVDTEDDI